MSFQIQILFRYVYEWSDLFAMISFHLFSYNLKWAFDLFFNCLSVIYSAQCRAKLNIELHISDRITLNRLWKQLADWQVLGPCYWNIFVIFWLNVLLSTLNGIDVSPRLAIGVPAIISIPPRETAILLVDNRADVTPVTVYVVWQADLSFQGHVGNE